MKNTIALMLALIFFSCGSNTDNTPVQDSANAIEDHPLQDTQVAPFPDGYAPPDTKIDTSQNKKDSIQAAEHK